MNKDEKAILARCIVTWGVNQQLDMVIEESAELIQAINKWKRKGNVALPNLLEEIADVEIMLSQLKLIVNKDYEIAEIKKTKINRVEKMLLK